MIKNNKWKLIISSVIIILPILAGLIMWDKLPDTIATHWNAEGTADGWSKKSFAVFFLPLFMLAIHWICMLVTAADPKNKNQNRKVFGMIFWICPLLSIFTSSMVYGIALGMEMNVELLTPALIGLMFIILENYLPKCKQNHTIGIKIPWTLNDEENWNKTHRLCGKLWVIGGLLLMASIFFAESVMVTIMLIVIIVLAIIPIVYSYALYRKNYK